ncbi:MAG: N-acetylmuramoyl-L-alanine amidase [Pseudomonadota bacterium]
MRAVLILLVALWAAPLPLGAQGLSALARVIGEETGLEQRRGRVTLTLGLSQGVPYRVYTLAEPNQLVIELSEVDWAGLPVEALKTRAAGPVRVGVLAPGWSGLVMDLDGPFELAKSAMRLSEGGRASLEIALQRTSQSSFAAASGLPASSAAILRDAPRPREDREALVVVIDPGHGGIDPGAERSGVQEAGLVLMMARELRDGLRRAGGFDVHLTRDEDVFVGLPERAAFARRLRADAFISLHADALPEGFAEGATIFTLSEDATDAASALLAERLNRADIIGGVDLGGQGDEVARILLDLVRRETAPRSKRLSLALMDGLEDSGARLNSNPQRAADFAVLRSADVPSVLVEVGFLSSDRDRIELQSPEKRSRIIDGLVRGLRNWAETDLADRALLRQ